MSGLRGDKEAPLSETRLRPLSSLHAGEKVALFYHRPREMYEVTADLFQLAIGRKELCVFESRAPAAQVEKELKALGLDLSKHPEIIVLPQTKERIRGLSQATIIELLRQFSSQARDQGFSGALLIMDVGKSWPLRSP
ncbi:MAG: hypothetical protein NT131_03180 [Methanomassiliicoccales archaeon]|nr:hypothetical protein [Methanomassiliicoccales archaeon]